MAKVARMPLKQNDLVNAVAVCSKQGPRQLPKKRESIHWSSPLVSH